MKDTSKKPTRLIVALIICTALVLLAAIGSWVFIQQRQIAQKDRQLLQQKEQQEAQRKFESQQDAIKSQSEAQESRTQTLRCNYNPQNC